MELVDGNVEVAIRAIAEAVGKDKTRACSPNRLEVAFSEVRCLGSEDRPFEGCAELGKASSIRGFP